MSALLIFNIFIFCITQRKGYSAQEEDIGVILAIHNIVNEKGNPHGHNMPTTHHQHITCVCHGGRWLHVGLCGIGWSQIREWELLRGWWVCLVNHMQLYYSNHHKLEHLIWYIVVKVIASIDSVMLWYWSMRNLFWCSSTPKLKKFMGRPKDISPKAYFMHVILG